MVELNVIFTGLIMVVLRSIRLIQTHQLNVAISVYC